MCTLVTELCSDKLCIVAGVGCWSGILNGTIFALSWRNKDMCRFHIFTLSFFGDTFVICFFNSRTNLAKKQKKVQCPTLVVGSMVRHWTVVLWTRFLAVWWPLTTVSILESWVLFWITSCRWLCKNASWIVQVNQTRFIHSSTDPVPYLAISFLSVRFSQFQCLSCAGGIGKKSMGLR